MKNLSLLTFAALLSACVTAPETHDFDNKRVINADFDETWENIISFFAENNIPVKTLEKDSGLIAAEDSRINSTDLLKWADCGNWPVSEHTGSLDMNIFARPDGPNQTIVQANADFGSTVKGQLSGSVDQVACNSRGVLEETLLDRIESNVSLAKG